MSIETAAGSLVADIPGLDSGWDAPLVASDASPELRDLLNAAWKRGPTIGRPPGLTTITNDDQIHDVIRAMRRDHVRPTQPAVAARGGWGIASLRGYLRVHKKDWRRDFLDT